MTREEKVRKAISVLMDCADAAKGTEFADYYLMGADSLRQQETVTNRTPEKLLPIASAIWMPPTLHLCGMVGGNRLVEILENVRSAER